LLLERLERLFLKAYHRSIEDLPVWNWWNIHKEGDYKFLIKKYWGVLSFITPRKLKIKLFNKVFEELQSEFIDTFGIDKNYAQYLRKKVEIELLKIKVAKTGDLSHGFMIDVITEELNMYLNKETGGNFNQGVIAIEKYMGFRLVVKLTSVFEYYSYVKSIELAIKSSKKDK
jgi:flagellin-specific chaperone FliS